MEAHKAQISRKPSLSGATMPAITHEPSKASASANQTRGGGCSVKNSAPPATVRIGATLPMNDALAIFVPVKAIWNAPTSQAKANPAKTSGRTNAAGGAKLARRRDANFTQIASAG